MTLSLSLAMFCRTLLSHSIFFSITCTSVTEGLWWRAGSCSGVSKHHGKRTSTQMSRMHLIGLGNPCSSAVHNQGQLTLFFNTILCGLQSKAANNRVNTQAHNRLLEKANENVENQRKHKFYKRWHHEIRHRGPPVKIAPVPYPLIRLC